MFDAHKFFAVQNYGTYTLNSFALKTTSARYKVQTRIFITGYECGEMPSLSYFNKRTIFKKKNCVYHSFAPNHYVF